MLSQSTAMTSWSFNLVLNETPLFCFIHIAVAVHVFKSIQAGICNAGNLDLPRSSILQMEKNKKSDL